MLGRPSHAKAANMRFATMMSEQPSASVRMSPSRATATPPTSVPSSDMNTPNPLAIAAISFSEKPVSR